ncbi:hypothetical protein R1flu_003162 [Riccia fluitans]|uniref:Uncharacterized protein n=1 Tax=Riccia fluitans TaxID=41844 RepID=A0ABD1YB83_9MARC
MIVLGQTPELHSVVPHRVGHTSHLLSASLVTRDATSMGIPTMGTLRGFALISLQQTGQCVHRNECVSQDGRLRREKKAGWQGPSVADRYEASSQEDPVYSFGRRIDRDPSITCAAES